MPPARLALWLALLATGCGKVVVSAAAGTGGHAGTVAMAGAGGGGSAGASTKRLVMTPAPLAGVAFEPLPTVEVQVQDLAGNVLTDNTDSITIGIAGAGGGVPRLAGKLTAAAAAGVASFDGLSVDGASSCVLTATSGATTA
jgi:hypothetical protein